MKLTRLQWAAIAVGVIAVAALLWLGFGGGDSPEEPRIVSEEELLEAAADADNPVYWAGPQPGTELELTEAADGSYYVRYLSGGAPAGDPRPAFLTVATYPAADGLAALETAIGDTANAREIKLPDGGLAAYNADRPVSVYVAFPDLPLQIEVFDPTAERTLGLVTGGQIEPL